MVIFAIVLCVAYLVRKDFSLKKLKWIDGIVLAMALLAFVTFLRFPGADTFPYLCKCLSAYLVYFLGRFGYMHIEKCTKGIVWSSYGILYANFIYRIITQKGLIFKITNEGELYYYKTDMAFGMIMAAIFIFFLGKRVIEKYISVFFVLPTMVMFSGARMQWFCLAAFYLLVILYMVEKKKGKAIRLGWKKVLIFLGVAAALFVSMIALLSNEKIAGALNFRTFDFSEGIFSETNTHSRGKVWPYIISQVNQADLPDKLFGQKWNGESTLLSEYRQATGEAVFEIHDSHNMYIKLLFSTGYVGLVLFIVFWITIFVYYYRAENRKMYYVSFATALLFLMSGISISAIVLTQMSWFAFLYAGVIVSERMEGKKDDSSEEKV
ncbi:MAG: O-antigen ligase family protein [Lachnospiraceae bacterium]|nr:O-antigen ligase family protein [Lachnospiraceae bacterium]